MRRKDREMDINYGLDLIDRSEYGVMSLNIDKDKNYSIPLSLVREGSYLYFHSAKSGKKVDLIEDGKFVSLTFVGEVSVPDNFTKYELDEMFEDEKKASKYVSSVFTTEFESAIVEGNIYLLNDEDEKVKVLRLICEKYTPDKMPYFEMAIKNSLDYVNIYCIDIKNISSKRKKYDDKGIEMKWGRMI